MSNYMNAKLADALEEIFPTHDGKWSQDVSSIIYNKSISDGRSVRLGLVRSLENYHLALTCSRPDGRVSGRHRMVFNHRNGNDRAADIKSRLKEIIDAELGCDFLRIARYETT